MILRITTLVILGLVFINCVVFCAEYSSKDGRVNIEAPVIEYYTGKIVARDGVHLTARNEQSRTSFKADAMSVVITLVQAPEGKDQISGTVKEIVMKGPVSLNYNSVENGVQTKINASADNADYSGFNGLAHLVGNVKIVNDNPAMFDAPSVATGEKATVNMRPSKIGEESFRFRIESAKERSRVEITPKSQSSNTQ